MTYIDSHAHLDSGEFAPDLPEVLNRARLAGVERILTVGCLTGEAGRVARMLEVLESQPDLVGAVGVHPHDARCFTPQVADRLASLLAHPKMVGLGEIGLDFHYDYSPREQQREAFREQLRMANRLRKPVIIHTREADEETCRILEAELESPASGVLHCFTSEEQTARFALGLGFCISFGGILSFRNAERLRAIAREIPADRLLIETDCPYLAPVPYRGRRNEPSFVVRVAEVLASERGVTAPVIGEQTKANFSRLFGLPAAVRF
ncbi:MAG: TatD family hydrolase [Acidobacteriota bacterium]